MPAAPYSWTSARRRRLSLGTVALANLLPLAGVAALDWSPTTLLVVYWLEAGAIVAWSVPKGLLAERRLPERAAKLGGGFARKRGGLELVEGGPTLYVRNVAVTLVLAAILTVWWFVYGGVALFGESTVAGRDAAAALGEPTVQTAALALFAGQGIGFLTDYVGRRRYEAVSASIVVRKPIGYVLALPVLTVALELFVADWARASVALGAVVLAKTAYEVDAERRRQRGDWTTPFGLDALDVDRRARLESEPEDLPDGEPLATARPSPPALYLGALVGTVVDNRLGVGIVGALLPLNLLLLAVSPTPPWFLLGLPLALLTPIFLYEFLERVVQRRWLTYEVYPDAVVARDGLFGTTQWAIPTDEIGDVRATGWLERRLLGTATVAFAVPDATTATLPFSEVEYEVPAGRTYRIAHVEHYEEVEATLSGCSA